MRGGGERADARLIASLLGVVLSVWAFVVVADLVTGGRAQRFDDRLLLALRVDGRPSEAVGPSWLPGAVRDLTALGSAPVQVFLVLGVAGAFAVRRQYHEVVVLIAASAGGVLLIEVLKPLFGRPRPDPAFRLVDVGSLGFPSGHALLSTIIYLTLAAIVARLSASRRLQLYVVGLASLLSFLVGASRVYLGVHYASDVLAGWAAGLAWALVCWTVASRLARRGWVVAPR